MGELAEVFVGVLAGGISEEREISLLSAEQVYLSLKRQNIKAKIIEIDTSDEEKVKELILKSRIDLAFIALHGAFGEDGKIQSILEEINLPYTGSDPEASYLAMDKIATKVRFTNKGIPTPNFLVIERQNFSVMIDKISFPCVVKPYFSGSSIGVSIVRRKEELEDAVVKAFSLGDKIIVEKYIQGRELTVGILEERPLAVVEIVSKKEFFDFQTKYSDGWVEFIAPAKLDEEVYKKVQNVALCAHKVLGCRHFSRVDLILSRENIPFCLEVNSIPGLTTHSLLPLSAKCCGIDFDALIRRMVVLAWRDFWEKGSDRKEVNLTLRYED